MVLRIRKTTKKNDLEEEQVILKWETGSDNQGQNRATIIIILRTLHNAR